MSVQHGRTWLEIMFNKDKMSIKEQIEAILARAEDKGAAEASRAYAHTVAVFYLELLDSGVEKEIAFQMTISMMYAMRQQ